jgi:hypothetical protein
MSNITPPRVPKIPNLFVSIRRRHHGSRLRLRAYLKEITLQISHLEQLCSPFLANSSWYDPTPTKVLVGFPPMPTRKLD